MLESFKMEISTDDMLRVLNVGIQQLNPFGKFISDGDRVVRVQYSRDTKRYTLVFESGKKFKVVPKAESAQSASV
jgi:hypothetical protein